MTYVVESIPIAKIDVGERRREKTGSLAALKSSLERVGQIHPITVRSSGDRFELVAGERRLESARALGWMRIRARIGKFTDEELRELELDENAVRLDLTDYEASKAKLRQIEAAEREAADEKPAQAAHVSPGGRGRKGGDSEASRRTGLSRDEVRRTKKHIAAAEDVPAFRNPDWNRSQVLVAKENLDKLPKRTQELAAEMISEPGVPSKVAVQIIETLVEKKPEERREIELLYRSESEEDRTLAKTRAAKRPPPPPNRLQWLRDALKLTEKAINDSHKVAQGDLRSAISSLKSALKASQDDYQRLRRKEGH